MFGKKTIPKLIWISPDGDTKIRIDYVLIDRRFRKVRARISLSRKSKRAVKDRINMGKLNKPNFDTFFQTQLNKNLKDLIEWGNQTKCDYSKKQKTWLDDECKMPIMK